MGNHLLSPIELQDMAAKSAAEIENSLGLRRRIDYNILTCIDNILVIAKTSSSTRLVTGVIARRAAVAGLRLNEHAPHIAGPLAVGTAGPVDPIVRRASTCSPASSPLPSVVIHTAALRSFSSWAAALRANPAGAIFSDICT
jgi:hypothetical protein